MRLRWSRPGLMRGRSRRSVPMVDQDRATRREIRGLERLIGRLLDEHGTTLRDEVGVGPIGAATLLCEVADPNRFATESKFSRWCGVGAVALSSGEGPEQPNYHRLDFGGNRRINSVLYMVSVTQGRLHPVARSYLERKRGEGKTRRAARRCHKRQLANRVIRRMWRDQKPNKPQSTKPLDKGASHTTRVGWRGESGHVCVCGCAGAGTPGLSPSGL